MSSTDLTVNTGNPQDKDTIDEPVGGIPLSPSSVRSYQKNKENKKKSHQDSDENEDDSDKKEDDEDEDEYDATHLDPRLEALDGTTKLKTAEQDEDEDEEEDPDQDYSNEEDEDIQTIGEKLSGINLQLGTPSTQGPNTVPSALAPALTPTGSNGATGTSQGELYQDPTSQTEPVKPHISLPCYIETATNPPRTRITLKFAGNHTITSSTSTSTMDETPSTRGRKNYMVATDLSGESWHATEWAITTILRSGDELNVVTIVEDDKSDANKGVKKGVQTEMREDAEKLTKNIHEQLEHTCLRDITVVIHIIAATKSMGAKELLIEMIDDLEDLSTVIVGSRGRGAIKGLLLGSISNFLVHNSSVPVMVVRAPKKSKGKKKMRRGRVAEPTRSVKEANLKYEQAFTDEY